MEIRIGADFQDSIGHLNASVLEYTEREVTKCNAKTLQEVCYGTDFL